MKETRAAYWTYVESVITPNQDDHNRNGNKKLRSFIKHRRTDSVGIAPLKESGQSQDPKRSVQLFVHQSPLNPPPQEADPIRQYPSISKLNITTECTQKLLKNLNPNKAMGPDRLHPRVLKETARALAPILQIIFYKSLENGEVPDDWKQTNITPINTWVEKFLKDRKQRVACEGMYLDWAPVISGVPQGSVIAPIPFLIYINDLPNNLKSTVQLFADDTIIYMTISNDIDATALQQDLDKLAKWEETWQMEFHPQKCSVLHITRSRNLKYKQHILHGHTRKGGQRKISWRGHKSNTILE